MKRKSCTFHTVFILCTCCLCPCTIQTNARWAFLRWFLSLLSALNIRFALSLEQKCWNGYSLMNCWPDKSVCVCVCLWLVVCEKWRLWLGVEGAAEPWDVRLWEHRRFLYHTHTQLWFWRTIDFIFLSDVLKAYQALCLQYRKFLISVEINALFYSIGYTKYM